MFSLYLTRDECLLIRIKVFFSNQSTVSIKRRVFIINKCLCLLLTRVECLFVKSLGLSVCY